jgi:hypothetical protein
MRTEFITEYNIGDDNGSAFGNEISLLYFKEQE